MQLEVLGPFPATFDGGVRAADKIADGPATAALAFDDVLALGVVRRLTELGYQVPADFSVSGCDDILFASMTLPPLTTVASPMAEAGRTAVDLLLDALDSTPKQRVGQVVLSGQFVSRGSTGPVPNRRKSKQRRTVGAPGA